MDRFKVGDIVQLKSGGPKMTVTSIGNGSDMVECTWFGDDNKPQYDTFPATALLKVGDNEVKR
jgi:uncharacterized protein YodC (DUF2158 family)